MDQSGAVIVGARVKLTGEDPSRSQEVPTGDDGQFSFSNVTPGTFQLTISSARFATHTSSGILHSGETYLVPQIALAVAADVEVQVGVSPEEVAEEQIKVQEKQRVLGFIPNFYVSYVPNPVPLTSKQKFKLAWKRTVDPITFLLVARLPESNKRKTTSADMARAQKAMPSATAPAMATSSPAPSSEAPSCPPS